MLLYKDVLIGLCLNVNVGEGACAKKCGADLKCGGFVEIVYVEEMSVRKYVGAGM